MKKTSKFLAALLAVAMLLSLGCFSLAAEDASKDTGVPSGEMTASKDDGAPADEATASKDDTSSTLAYGDLEGVPGDNAVVSYHEDSVVYVSDGVEKTAAIGEGQVPFLVVNGVNVPMAVGNYDGTVAVNVVDAIYESADYNTADKDVSLSTDLYSVLYFTEDGLQTGQSILDAAVGGEITDTSVSGVTIESKDAAVSGIRAGGTSVVEVSDVVINLTGTGGNDFMGEGTALCATDASHLIARNVVANVSGFVRGCTFAGGNAVLEVYDSVFNCDAGDYDESGSAPGAGMSQPPAGLGVYGNARANNLVDYATEYFENCVFNNRNWGALGVDAVNGGTLTCVDCEINVTESGYGAYSIGPCVDTFTGCTFNIHNGVVAFVAVNGTVILDGGTVANSDRYGIVTHQAMNTVSTVKVLGEGTEINAAYCAIMIKGRSSDIEVGDGATLSASETGVIIQAQDNDDTGAGTVNSGAEVPVYIHDTALSGDIVMSMAPTDTAAMNVTLENATITGAISLSNSTLVIADGSISLDNILDVGMIENEYGPRADACYLNVELKDGAVWNVTETSYVTTLTVDSSSVVNGTVTEADGYYIVEPDESAPAAPAASAAPAALAASGASESIDISINGVSIEAVDVTIGGDGTYSIDLSAVLASLGLSLSYDESTGYATVTGNGELLSSLYTALTGEAGEEEEPRPEPGVVEGVLYISDYVRAASALYVSGGEYTFDNTYFYGAGFSSEEDMTAERSSQYGYCAAILATSPSSNVTLNNPTIETYGDSQANGVFATNCAKITVNGGTIDTNNGQGHGVDATYFGHVYIYDTVIHTGGGSSGALATDYGGGFITADGISATTETSGSPGIYCAGSSVIYCTNSSFVANNSEGVMNAHDHGVVVLSNCDVYGYDQTLNGHQALPSPAQSTGSYCFIFGGSLASGAGPIINQNNGRTETTLVGVKDISLAEGYEYVIHADDDASGILTVNLFDTELVGDVYCGAGASVTVNIYGGGSLVGEVVGDGEVILNVYNGGSYTGSYAANVIDETVEAPVLGDFDYYLTNYWAAGNQKWTGTTITTYTDDVELTIIDASAAALVIPGASAVAYDAETTDLSEGGISANALDLDGAYGFGAPGENSTGGAEPAENAMGDAEPVDKAAGVPTASGDRTEDSYKEYLKEYFAATPDVEANLQEFLDAVSAGSYDEFPVVMAFEGWFSVIPLTLSEYLAGAEVILP